MGRAEAKEQTRDALLLAALESFADEGLEGPSLDAISARAGRTRGAFYVHFSDREALVEAVVERVMREYLEALAAASTSGGLHAIVGAFGDLLLEAPDSPRPFLRLGTRHFHLILAAGARYPRVRKQLDGAILQGSTLLGATLGDPGLADTLTALLMGLLCYRPADVEPRIHRIRATLEGLL